MKAKSIGMVYAICDHFEQATGQPATLSTLIVATGFDRSQFRKWVRQGRLVEHRVRTLGAPDRIAFTRPKIERSETEDVVHREENSETSEVISAQKEREL